MSTRIARVPLAQYDDEGLYVLLLRGPDRDRVLSIETGAPGKLVAVVAMEIGNARLPNDDQKQRIICIVDEHTRENVWRSEGWRYLDRVEGHAAWFAFEQAR